MHDLLSAEFPDLGLLNLNKHIHLINCMIKLARHWCLIPAFSPNQQPIKRLMLGDHTQRFLSEAEIDQLLKCCRRSSHPYLHHFVRLLLLTGARKGEARTARWGDIDLDKRVWTVPRSKNGRSRRIVLNNKAMETLQDVRITAERMSQCTGPSLYVFTNPSTGRAYNSFYAAWYVARDRAELQDVRIHDLRHTFASLLVNKGVSLYEVQTLLGHSSVQMTQRYAHLAPDRLHSRAEIVGDIVGGGI